MRIINNIFNIILALGIPGGIIYFYYDLPFRVVVFFLVVAILVYLIGQAVDRRYVDVKIFELMGVKDCYAFTKSLPGYRFVDLYNAASFIASQSSKWVKMESKHSESLEQIFNSEFYPSSGRRVKKPARIARPISEHDEGYFPSDSFWIQEPTFGATGGIMRVRLQEYTHEVILEVGAKEKALAEKILKQVLKRASDHSIFKNKMIQVSFQPEVKDSYGDIERYEEVDLIFLKTPAVTEDDIILDNYTRSIIQRSILDFHERRKELITLGLPGHRGILFYGPPGTGKTYTCKYISHRLDSATTIIATGLSLLHVKSICNIARMLQPSVVILEDIDLVYASRDININTPYLGELMDELDGFNPEDHIIFILTTNAIERVEEAIRNRPGRISQLVSFGPPIAELRRLYLESILAPYNCSQLNMNELIAKTERATQAFLIELVYRVVQIASESQPVNPKELALTNENFREALEEMKISAGRSGETILGFHA